MKFGQQHRLQWWLAGCRASSARNSSCLYLAAAIHSTEQQDRCRPNAAVDIQRPANFALSASPHAGDYCRNDYGKKRRKKEKKRKKEMIVINLPGFHRGWLHACFWAVGWGALRHSQAPHTPRTELVLSTSNAANTAAGIHQVLPPPHPRRAPVAAIVTQVSPNVLTGITLCNQSVKGDSITYSVMHHPSQSGAPLPPLSY